MEKLMPIVPGCKAVIVSSRLPQTAVNIGREVTVVRRGTKADGGTFEGSWLVAADSLMCAYEYVDTGEFHFEIGGSLFTKEHRLMRIDGGDFEEEGWNEAFEDLVQQESRKEF